MNLTEALDAALPEIPRTRLARSRPPRLDPDLIVRQDLLDGEPIVGVFQRDRSSYFRFPPDQWQLLLLFDGVRSFEEIAAEFSELSGNPMGAQDVRLVADTLEEANFWYKSPQEKNLAMSQRLNAQRGRRAGSKSKINLAHISFSAWDPDRYLGWLDGKIGKYLYSPWCALAVLMLFVFEGAVFVDKWSLIGPDIKVFYNFTEKGLPDFIEFWILIFVLGFIHETAHGLTCKHFGGQVHSMGMMFLYCLPAFCVDVSEVWISATKLQRLATVIAGIWIEMVINGLAMIVWLNTHPGQWIHDFAYLVILLTGVAVVVLNLNPLLKLDGYYFITEAMGIPDLKERSTEFLTGWFQSRILRLPVDTIVVPRRRVPLFAVYAFLSGAYSYLMLFFVLRLAYNIAAHWLAEFALFPVGLLAFTMFRSRLRSLRKVILEVWRDKFSGGRLWRPVPVTTAGLVVALLFAPIWRDRQSAWFVIEPARTESLHAAVPGHLEQVLVTEGETVHAGQPLLRMSSLMAASMHSSAAAQRGDSQYQAITAELQGQSIGVAAAQQNASLRSTSLAREAVSSLEITAPADGVVLTQDPASLLNQDVAVGQPLLDLAADGPRVARVYVPVYALERIHPGDEVAFQLPGRFSVARIPFAAPGGDPVTLPPGLIANQKYKGVKPPVYYCTRLVLPASAGNPLIGDSGQALIFGDRRSLAALFFEIAADLVKTHLW
jgi:putative peptide zinc metalloprotease protein